MKPLLEQNLTESIIGAFFDVYNRLGYGLLEQLYATALDRELASRGHRVAREVGVPVFYKGERIGLQRLDLLVDGRIIVE